RRRAARRPTRRGLRRRGRLRRLRARRALRREAWALSMAAIEIAGVTKTFGTHVAVDDLTLSVAEGSIYGFIGPNGSGKTTTLRMIMNILLPDRGQIRVLRRQEHRAADYQV